MPAPVWVRSPFRLSSFMARHDHMTPLVLAHELHAAIAGSILVEVPGGHISLVTRQRRRFAEELSTFMAS